MILIKLVVGQLGTNCYIFGSKTSKDVVIIDPGGHADIIIKNIEQINAKPIAILLTHGHFDHVQKVGRIMRHFQIPLMYNKKEFDSGIYTRKKADKWLNEGDFIKIGEITLKILHAPGHSPGSICFYTNDVKKYNDKAIDGVIFSGDLIFRRSVGRSDMPGGDSNQLFSSIKTKIMHNAELTNNFIIFPGHMGITSIGAEKELNYFRNYFL